VVQTDSALPEDCKMLSKIPKKTLCHGWALVSGVCLIIGGLLAAFLFQNLVDAIIRSKVPLLPGTDISKAWISPPVKPLLKIYYFNVTNPQEYLAGQKLRVAEVGPYVYEEKWEREGVAWSNDDKQVNFRMKRTYYFRADLTSGSLEDLVTLPNVPMLAMLNKMRNTGPDLLASANIFIPTIEPKQEVFETNSVADITWGYKHPLVDLANQILPPDQKLPEKYGYFYGKNGSSDGEFSVLTGSQDVSSLGSILSFNNKTRLTAWGNSSDGAECNAIHGTDGSVFPPFVTKNQTFHIFQKDMCRSLPLQYSETVYHHDLETFRFTPAHSAFTSSDSSCFCPKGDGEWCAPEGMFNVTACQGDAPMLLSWPHFYRGDPALLDQVAGLTPDKEKHEFGIDILPQLGVGLRAAIRLQINIFIQKEGVSSLSNATDVYLPIVWFDDGLEELTDEDTIALLKSAVVEPARIQSILYPVLLVVGIILVMGAAISLGISIRKKQKSKTEYAMDMQSRKSKH